MAKKLKIAMFCTNEWPTPPPQDTFYAPLWIAFYIAEGIAQKGHQVYYFGSQESKLKYAKLISCQMPALKKNRQLLPFLRAGNEEVVNFYEQLMLSQVYQMDQKERFDVIHVHPYRRVLPFAPLTETPTLITLHDPLTGFKKYVIDETKEIKNIYLASISHNQRKPSPHLKYAGTAYNGIDLDKFKFNPKPEDFFLAVGRFVPEKGIDLAVEIAQKAKVKLKIAGGPARGVHFKTKIEPFLGKNIEYLGMLKYHQMGSLYRRAKGLLYPLRWQEPFGLVMTESMACGTPVIAFPYGSVPELIKNNQTGFIVKTIPQAVKAVKKIGQIDRKACREHVEKHFSIQQMVASYEKIYYKIAKKEA